VKIIYSTNAVEDLIRLRKFIAEKDPSAAARVADDLVSRIINLSLFPEMGRSIAQAPEPNSVRESVFGKYIVRYTAHVEAVIILRIWHQYENRT
jgi:plasmid stabilization system protein ParE